MVERQEFTHFPGHWHSYVAAEILYTERSVYNIYGCSSYYVKHHHARIHVQSSTKQHTKLDNNYIMTRKRKEDCTRDSLARDY